MNKLTIPASATIAFISSIVTIFSTFSLPFLFDKKQRVESVISIDKDSIDCTYSINRTKKVKCIFLITLSQDSFGFIYSRIIVDQESYNPSIITIDGSIFNYKESFYAPFYSYENEPVNISIEFNNLDKSIDKISVLNIDFLLRNNESQSIQFRDIAVRPIDLSEN